MKDLRIDLQRLQKRLADLAEIGPIDGGGSCRLALTDDDRRGRDRVCGWMRDLGMEVSVDQIGNVVAIRKGREGGPPVATGSHIDTVRTGGTLDGNLGVLAGLEVVSVLNEAAIETRRPLAVCFFTNEEGSRFQPDMMGSGVQQGALALQDMLAVRDIEGAAVKDELERIGYVGEAPCDFRASAFVELHIEQGPVLDREGGTIGAVTGVQGISWTELTLEGVSNHAGTTPMSMRCDAGYAAAAVAVAARDLAKEIGPPQVATVGQIVLTPNLVNVVASRAVMTIDLRHTDEATLKMAEERMFGRIDEIASREGVKASRRRLARFQPVAFDDEVIATVEKAASALGHDFRRLPSGAGHDAQMFAPNCPTGMIFVPSVDGISHNPREHTEAHHLEAGANTLLHVLLELAGA